MDYSDLDGQLSDFIEDGNLFGLICMYSQGGDLYDNDYALRLASGNGHLDTVKYLVEHGVTMYDDALQWAAESGHLEIIKYLVNHGANIRAKNDKALYSAVVGGYLEIVKYLISHGADIDVEDYYLLCGAAGEGHLDIVKFLVEPQKYGAPSTVVGLTLQMDQALYWAARKGHLEIVKYLIEVSRGVDLDTALALLVAIEGKYHDIVDYLRRLS